MECWLVRHGESTWNSERPLPGRARRAPVGARPRAGRGPRRRARRDAVRRASTRARSAARATRPRRAGRALGLEPVPAGRAAGDRAGRLGGPHPRDRAGAGRGALPALARGPGGPSGLRAASRCRASRAGCGPRSSGLVPRRIPRAACSWSRTGGRSRAPSAAGSAGRSTRSGRSGSTTRRSPASCCRRAACSRSTRPATSRDVGPGDGRAMTSRLLIVLLRRHGAPPLRDAAHRGRAPAARGRPPAPGADPPDREPVHGAPDRAPRRPR